MISTPGGIGNHQKATGHQGIIVMEGNKSEPPNRFDEIIAAAVELAIAEERTYMGSMERDYEAKVDGLIRQLDETDMQVRLYRRILYSLIAAVIIFAIAVLFL